jgi:hypothetical protein
MQSKKYQKHESQCFKRLLMCTLSMYSLLDFPNKYILCCKNWTQPHAGNEGLQST